MLNGKKSIDGISGDLKSSAYIQVLKKTIKKLRL
jgi:hypothetical protein